MAFDGSREQYYEARAADLRALAEKCKIPEIKFQLEVVAKQYENLAAGVRCGVLTN